MHLVAGEVVERGERRRRRPGDHDLDHRLVGRDREIDALRALRSDGEVGDSEVTGALQQSRQQLLARGRQRDHGNWPGLQLVLLVEVDLEVLERVRHQAALRALVVEEQRPRVRHQHPYHAPLEHAVEVAAPRLQLGLEGGDGLRLCSRGSKQQWDQGPIAGAQPGASNGVPKETPHEAHLTRRRPACPGIRSRPAQGRDRHRPDRGRGHRHQGRPKARTVTMRGPRGNLATLRCRPSRRTSTR